MPVGRSLVALALLVGVLLLALLHRWWAARPLPSTRRATPLVPADLRGDAERTWVVFTTPYCASCGPVEDRLRSSDPGARVVRVDATSEPQLVRDLAIRSAPTVVLADATGHVRARLVGADAVERWLLAHS